jgi:hypothetical protein
MSMLNNISNVLAKVLHPVFLLFYTVFICELLQFTIASIGLIGVTLGMTVLLPILFIYFYNQGDLYLQERSKRIIPLLFTGLCYLACYIIEKYALDNSGYGLIIISFGIGLILLGIISRWYKISLHAGGYGIEFIFLLLITALYNLFGTKNLLLPISLDVIAAILFFFILRQRYISGAHKLGEIISGLLFGLLLGSGCIYYYFN